ncbi:VOC family protein [Chryseolinea sp. T2]|uniref:VOC family protein n=1 Tax=Chryseolinea sp. T2 TaxID=3129255 RepID=UPI0030774FDB
MSNRPTYANGKICYLEIPATDVAHSANFYSACFGWSIRADYGGNTTFDDSVNQVSGMWVTGVSPMTEPGITISIMVADAEATSNLIVSNGGRILKKMAMDRGEIIIHFQDPAGNFMGLYQGNELKE